MNPFLSIIITSHNDANQTALTLASIRETTAPEDNIEVIVIDDCSATPLHHYVKEGADCTKLITNRWRCGCGPSRHIGALHASGDWLLIVDSHMRFTPLWFEEFGMTAKIDRSPKGVPLANTVWCATCLGLDSKHMDVNAPVGVYHGATMNFLGPNRVKPDEPEQVFEATWLRGETEDGQEIPAVMGACYFVSRNWFLYLAPTRFLRTWGGDEQQISLKSWLAGGSVRLAKNVRIGHKFLIDGKEKQTWGCPLGHVLWSKLFGINTLLPEPMAELLTAKLLMSSPAPDAEAARQMLRSDWHLIAEERAFNKSIFTMSVYDYAKKFSIPLP